MADRKLMVAGKVVPMIDQGDGTFAPLAQVGGSEAYATGDFGPSGSKNYSAGQIMGSLIEVANAARVPNRGGLMTSAGIVLAAAFSGQIDVLIFNSQPAASFTDGAALALSLADAKRLSKVYHVTDWTSLASAISWGQAPAEARIYQCRDQVKTTSLWALMVARSAVTLAAVTDATVSLRMARN